MQISLRHCVVILDFHSCLYRDTIVIQSVCFVVFLHFYRLSVLKREWFRVYLFWLLILRSLCRLESWETYEIYEKGRNQIKHIKYSVKFESRSRACVVLCCCYSWCSDAEDFGCIFVSFCISCFGSRQQLMLWKACEKQSMVRRLFVETLFEYLGLCCWSRVLSPLQCFVL